MIISALSGRKYACLSIACLASILCSSNITSAQSGRRIQKDDPAPPAVVAEPAVETDKPAVRVSSLIIGGEIVHDYKFFRSTYLGSAVKECKFRLKQRPKLEVTTNGDNMNYNQAKELAKNQTDAFVLWFSFVSTEGNFGKMQIDYIDYAVLMPKTSKRLTYGRVRPGQPNAAGRGGVLLPPPLSGRSSALSQMKGGVREIADTLMRWGWL